MKERLVGAAVLIAIAVWLIPWVLDGPDDPLPTSGSSLELPAAEEPMPMRTQTLTLGEPPQPRNDSAAAPTPATQTAAATPPAGGDAASRADAVPAEPGPAAAPAARVAAATTPAAERPRPQPSAPAATPPPRPAATPAAGDWTVQLGSFGEEANARRVAQRAGVFGYKAEVSSLRSGGRTLYRVRVGPQRTRAEADATASALRAHGIDDASVVAAR